MMHIAHIAALAALTLVVNWGTSFSTGEEALVAGSLGTSTGAEGGLMSVAEKPWLAQTMDDKTTDWKMVLMVDGWV
jgi:hypothetical protein